ncbi:MAG: pyridoxal-dependent decarboxylase, exosortase A system-associated, partial [Gammaproteobacteria bacterium]|nr:pyridoxal-dependent decarboxylase, exosortase A system-associated [Gammaproteobacteria bacterium]
MTIIETDQHAPIGGFTVDDGCLCVGGQRVDTLIAAQGVPAYLYDRSLISQRVVTLRQSLPQRVHLHYAIKANPHPEIVTLLADAVDGLDVASAREIDIAMAAGGDPEHISFAGPGKRATELARAVSAGIITNIESVRELEILAQLGQQQSVRPRIA